MFTGDRRLSGGLKTDVGSIVSNKFDDHFKKSNLNYVMRRTTYKIQNGVSAAANSYQNYRTNTA